ncbi:MAG: hypothetical protein CFH40_01179, partial [Alphaproteobacteria bacterium MarineAlpha10_Bin3]
QGSAVELAQKLITGFGSLRALAEASVDEIRGHHGIGPAKAAQIKAALELAPAATRGHRRPTAGA